jgi:hypothetical protein
MYDLHGWKNNGMINSVMKSEKVAAAEKGREIAPTLQAEMFLWVIIILGSALCFLPLYQNSKNNHDIGNTNLDTNLLVFLQGIRFFQDSCVFRIAITFVQTIEILVEYGSTLAQTYMLLGTRTATVTAAAPSSVKIARLKDSERLTFLLGLSAIALVFAPRLQEDLVLVLRCVTNFCTVSTICPILMYLHRCTSTWSLPAVVVVAVVVCTGSVLSSASLVVYSAAPPTASLQKGAAVLFMIAVGLIGILSLMCLARYSVSKLPYLRRVWAREGSAPDSELGASIHEMAKFNDRKLSAKANSTAVGPVARPTDEFYTNVLPAAYIACLVVLISLALLHSLGWGTDGYTMGMYNYVYMGLGLFVCVVEIRLRKNEVNRSLVGNNAIMNHLSSFLPLASSH